MSYIPKYILKRMLPKDCVTLDGDSVKIAMVNVISPIGIDEVPEDALNYLAISVDGKEIEDLSKVEVQWGEKVYTPVNFKEAMGETIAVGDKLNVTIPNTMGLAKGEKHEFDVTIKTDNPVNVKFEREVQ